MSKSNFDAVLRDSVIERGAPYLESECVLQPPSIESIDGIIAAMQTEKHFVMGHNPLSAPQMPQRMRADGYEFEMPCEITFPRDRAYFMDVHGQMFMQNIDARQEQKPGGHIKQMVKIDAKKSPHGDVMSRIEYAGKVGAFGFNPFALKKKARASLENIDLSTIRPAAHIVSQRIRISYHPVGDPDILIEAAFEKIHAGETFFGHEWNIPKIDLEVARAPKNTVKAHNDILKKEIQAFQNITKNTLQIRHESSSAEGFAAVMDHIQTKKGRAEFLALNPYKPWWQTPKKIEPFKLFVLSSQC